MVEMRRTREEPDIEMEEMKEAVKEEMNEGVVSRLFLRRTRREEQRR